MRRTEVQNGVRMLKFRDVFGRCQEGRSGHYAAFNFQALPPRYRQLMLNCVKATDPTGLMLSAIVAVSL